MANKGLGRADTAALSDQQDVGDLPNVRIVMMYTTHPGNIGAVARAMKNMAMWSLVLVAPKCYPDPEAVFRASNAIDVLDKAIVVETFEEAIADCGLVIGTSSRERAIPWPLLNPRDCAEKAYAEAGKHPVAIVFGREDRGLTNEELQRCDLHVHIPTNPLYPSLNVAMAVQLLCYEVRMAYLQAINSDDLSADPMQDWDAPLANAADVERFMEHLEITLTEMGVIKPRAPKQLMTRLRRLFTRARMDELEVSLMRGVLTSAQNWVKKGRASDKSD